MTEYEITRQRELHRKQCESLAAVLSEDSDCDLITAAMVSDALATCGLFVSAASIHPSFLYQLSFAGLPIDTFKKQMEGLYD